MDLIARCPDVLRFKCGECRDKNSSLEQEQGGVAAGLKFLAADTWLHISVATDEFAFSEMESSRQKTSFRV